MSIDIITRIAFLAAGILLSLAGLVILLLFVDLQNPVMAAIAGAVFTALAIEGFTVRRENRKTTQERERILQAIHAEMESLLARYMQVAGDEIQEHLDSNNNRLPLLCLQKSPHDYFVVFNGLSGQLGIIEHNLTKMIIEAYILVKAMFDALVSFGERSSKLMDMIQERDNLSNMARVDNRDSQSRTLIEKAIEDEKKSLNKTFENIICRDHISLVKSFNDTIAAIKEALK